VTRTIDVHHHILPDFFWQETNDAHNPVGGIAPPPWDASLMVSFMDEAGIDVAVNLISTPGVHVGDDTRARSLARRCNELSAELMQARPTRLGGFAALPLPDVDGALEELAYALDELKLDGVVLFSNANGVYLGDSRFEPVFAELDRRGAVVFVHPTASPDPSAHSLGLPDTLIDFTADTTRAVAQMHYSNRFARNPSRAIHFSLHAGGTVPYLAGRWAIIDEMNVIPGADERGTAADTLRRLYWDTAASYRAPGASNAAGYRRPRSGLSSVRIFPYLRRDLAVSLRPDAQGDQAELSAEERTGVMSGNALKLFPRFAE